MKKIKNRKRFIITVVLALLATFLVTPMALSYFNSLQEQGISIRAKPASEIWEISGSFDEKRWKQSNKTGIYIKNKSHRDLWISFEYGGQLTQVFKHSDPVLIPAGTMQEIVLQPLDDKDSPRILNPLELINCKGLKMDEKLTKGKNYCLLKCEWKTFSGQLTVHILNKYASLASGPIKISGETLWHVFFSRKYGLNPSTYYEKCWEQGSLKLENQSLQAKSRVALQGVELIEAANQEQDKAEDFVQEWEEYHPLILLQPVMQVVEKVAPGLLKERNYFLTMLCNCQIKLNNLSAMLDDFKSQEKKLREQIIHQQDFINTLTNRINELEMLNQKLGEQINHHSPSPGNNSAEPSPETGGEPGTSGGNDADNGGGNPEGESTLEENSNEAPEVTTGATDGESSPQADTANEPEPAAEESGSSPTAAEEQ
jgi:hypothetical protein